MAVGLRHCCKICLLLIRHQTNCTLSCQTPPVRGTIAYHYDLVVSSRICTSSSAYFWVVQATPRWDSQPTEVTRACTTFISSRAREPHTHGLSLLVYRFMSLDPNEVGYFISQVGLAAASFGVASSDITIVANALVSLFDYRCTPPVTIVPGAGPQLQEICGDPTCPIAATPQCKLYDNYGVEPAPQTAPSCQSKSTTYTSSSKYSTTTPYTSSTMYTSTKTEYTSTSSKKEEHTSTSTSSKYE